MTDWLKDPGLKRFRIGTHRTALPEETLDRLRPAMERCGVTRLADVTRLDRIGIPVVMAVRPLARSLAVSQGKGVDAVSAQVSGLMESLELWCAEQGHLPLRVDRPEALAAEGLVDLSRLPRLSGAPDFAGRRMPFVRAQDMLNERSCWVPWECVHTDFTVPLPDGAGPFVCASSGLASGNHPLEALSHALCELVERDAEAIWSQRPKDTQDRLRFDLRTVDDPVCRGLLDRFEAAGVAVVAYDLTSDVQIASVAVEIADNAPSPFRAAITAGGMGCHPSRGVALSRALTEAAQSRLTVISGSRDDIAEADYDPVRAEVGRAKVVAAAHGPGARQAFSAMPDWARDTFEGDVVEILGRLRNVGIDEVAALRLDPPNFPACVVRAVVPGLETKVDLPGWRPGARAQAAARRAPEVVP